MLILVVCLFVCLSGGPSPSFEAGSIKVKDTCLHYRDIFIRNLVGMVIDDQIILRFLLNKSFTSRSYGLRNMKIHASFDFSHFIFFCMYSIMPVKSVRSKKHFCYLSFFDLLPSRDIIVKRKLNKTTTTLGCMDIHVPWLQTFQTVGVI